MKTSRDLANNLRKLAEWLDSKTEFELATEHEAVAAVRYSNYYDNKAGFLAAVRAIGSGKKVNGLLDSYLGFKANTPEGTEFEFEVNRSQLCRLVKPAQEAVYDCEPLLSQAEEAEMEAK